MGTDTEVVITTAGLPEPKRYRMPEGTIGFAAPDVARLTYCFMSLDEFEFWAVESAPTQEEINCWRPVRWA